MTSLTLGALGIAALVAAVIVELRVPEPVVPMDLFRNRTVVLAVLGSIVLGLVMFGGSVFLGQYFQVARGYAPTEAGLLTLPLVGGLMIASTVSGQLISRYGRWKGFLVAGAILTTAGLALLSTMDHTTSIPLLGVYLGVLGLGVGMSMQNLVLAVQNTVDVTEIGTASSLVAFLRSMGGTIGVTVLGIVLSHRVSALLGVPASGASSGTADLSQLDGAAAAAVRAAYGDAIGTGVPHRGDRLDPDAGGRGVHQGGPAPDDGRPLPRGGPGRGGGAGTCRGGRPDRGGRRDRGACGDPAITFRELPAAPGRSARHTVG